MDKRWKSISMALAIAFEISEKYKNVTVIRKKDGFVILYIKLCEKDKCKKVLVWLRKSPITEKAVKYMARTLKRIAHDEVWLVKMYSEPDFSEAYHEFISKEFNKREFEEYLSKIFK